MDIKNYPPIVLYLIGLAGTGKLTIAHNLQALGFKIIDNHLINDPIFQTLDLEGGASIPGDAWDAVHEIRDIVLNYIAKDCTRSFLFTNELLEGSQTDQMLYQKIQSVANRRKAIFVPIRLLISEEERSRRIVSQDRKKRCKFVGIDKRPSLQVMSLSYPYLLNLDVTNLSAQVAAKTIEHHIHTICHNF